LEDLEAYYEANSPSVHLLAHNVVMMFWITWTPIRLASTPFPRHVLHDDAAPSLVSTISLDVPSVLSHTGPIPCRRNPHHSPTAGRLSLITPLIRPLTASAFLYQAVADLAPETSTATHLPSTSQMAGVSLQHNETLLSPSDSPILPSSASSNTVYHILHTDPSLPSHSAMTRTDP
jgi:hypothetical protein